MSESRFDYLKKTKKKTARSTRTEEEEGIFQSSKTGWLLFFSRPCCAYIATLEIMKKGQTTVEMIQYFSMSIV